MKGAIANTKQNGRGNIGKHVMEKWTSLLQITLFSAEISVLKLVIRLKIKIITN